MYEEHNGPPDEMPVVIMVRFEKCTHGCYEKSGCVPFAPITKVWKDGNVNCARKQFTIFYYYHVFINSLSCMSVRVEFCNWF